MNKDDVKAPVDDEQPHAEEPDRAVQTSVEESCPVCSRGIRDGFCQHCGYTP